MNTLIKIHIFLATSLILFHGIFLFRGLWIRKKRKKPVFIDKLSKNISQIFYPFVLLSGFLLIGKKDGIGASGSIHIITALMPLAAIIFFTPMLKLKRKIPWLLPSINLFLFVLAGITGIIFAASSGG